MLYIVEPVEFMILWLWAIGDAWLRYYEPF